MQTKIILLTGYDHFFGQQRKPWVSLNTGLLKEELHKKGYDVAEYQFHDICNKDIDVSDAVVFYTFSQRDYLRRYIKDTIFHLHSQGAKVIPHIQLLSCHENKGYQELYKKTLGITALPAKYFSSKRELLEYTITYPVVLKTIEGSNGRGVFLLRDTTDLSKVLASLEPRLSLKVEIDLLRRRYFRLKKNFPGYVSFDSNKDFLQYKDYITPETSFILQDFIPSLKFDYRVIILGSHYYVTKRLTRKGDFRASGAKRFTFDFVADDSLLNYAREIYEMFDSPFLSIDIGEANGQYYLFEYQALHFGINAIVRGNGYYLLDKRQWQFIQKKTVFESELAAGLDYYLDNQSVVH